jgi:hypothetical protein
LGVAGLPPLLRWVFRFFRCYHPKQIFHHQLVTDHSDFLIHYTALTKTTQNETVCCRSRHVIQLPRPSTCCFSHSHANG